MSLNHILLNACGPAQVKKADDANARPLSWGSYRSRKFANFTREVHDFPNATVSISIGGSAGWVEQLAGITNVTVGSGISLEGAKRIPFGQSAYIGQTLYRGFCRSSILEGFEEGYLAGSVLSAGPEALMLIGNVQQITMVEPVDSAKLAQHIVLQEYSLSAQLLRLRKLQAGWDDDAAPAISKDTGDTADEVIKQVHQIALSHLAIPTTRLAPLPDGTVRFECTYSNRELFLTISNKAVEIQAWQPLDAVESVGYWKTDAAGVREHLEWLVK